jgi:hypothetical protein
MNRTLTVFLLTNACLIAAGQSVSRATPTEPDVPFTLEITANPDSQRAFRWDFANSAQTQVRVGTPIFLSTRKTNISDHEIDKWSSLGRSTEVRDENGNLIKVREPDNTRPIVSGGDGMLRGTKDTVLQPHESKIHTAFLSEGFDLSQPGTYTVQVSEHISNDPQSPTIKSNIITIIVLPKSAPAPK